MKIGYARVDITPDVSVPLAGLGNTLNRMSKVILDRVYTTCLAFTDEEGNTTLIYTSDLIRSIPGILDQVRQSILETHGIAPEHVMFASTHTHSATDYWQDEHPNVQRATQILIKGMIEAAALALEDRKPASISVGRSNPQALNFIRHYARDPETNALIGHLYEPDNQLQIIKLEREGGKDILIMNWQGHPCFTSGYDRYDMSADYIHSVRLAVENGTDMLFAFFLGASGDVNANSRIKEELVAPDRDKYASAMYGYVEEALANMQPVADGKITVLSREITVEIDHTDDHRIEEANIVLDYWKETYNRKATDAMAKTYGINSPYHAGAIIRRSKMEQTQQMPLAVVAIGDLAFTFVPYEMFCSNGAFVKEHSPFGATIVSTCSNFGFAYLADDFAFEDQCYEVDNRNFVRGTAEKLASAFVAMLEEVKG